MRTLFVVAALVLLGACTTNQVPAPAVTTTTCDAGYCTAAVPTTASDAGLGLYSVRAARYYACCDSTADGGAYTLYDGGTVEVWGCDYVNAHCAQYPTLNGTINVSGQQCQGFETIDEPAVSFDNDRLFVRPVGVQCTGGNLTVYYTPFLVR